MLYNWIPNRSVGDLALGSKISHYKNLVLVEEEFHESVDWNIYRLKDNDTIRVYVEKKNIISILCYEKFFYQGINLIGKKLKEVEKILEQKTSEFGEPVDLGNDGIQIPVEFESIGLQAWVRDGAGTIVSIFANSNCRRWKLCCN